MFTSMPSKKTLLILLDSLFAGFISLHLFALVSYLSPMDRLVPIPFISL